jgi:hypothetical protein
MALSLRGTFVSVAVIAIRRGVTNKNRAFPLFEEVAPVSNHANIWERAKLSSLVPTGTKTEIANASEGQQQFTPVSSYETEGQS